LTENELITISEAIKSNHTLLGVHISGNTAENDEKGFIQNKHSKEVGNKYGYEFSS